MSGLGFLVILRDAGDAAAALCADIAEHARPGDAVILVDDTGPGASFHTSAVVRQFGAMQGWPAGVTLRHICTGVRGAGDWGIAVNLALAEVDTDHLIVLPGTARLGGGFAEARALTAGHDLITCAVQAPDLIAPATPSSHLSRLIFARALAGGLACAEGFDAGGALPLLAGLLARAQTPAHCAAPAVLLPPLPRITPDWLAHWQAHLPDPALIDEALEGAAPGTRAVVAGWLSQHSRRVQMPPKVPLSAPQSLAGAPLRVLTPGPHGHRSPLRYEALRPLWQGRGAVTSEPAQADLICFAHPWDVRDMEADVARLLEKRPETPVALFSEEPFWDTLFSPDPLAGRVTLPAAHLGRITLAQENHHTSPVFEFDRIPYFLLTDPGYAARYAGLFARNAALAAQEWQAAFEARPTQAVFMAERRTERFHDIRNAAGGITGLCAWRTRLAEGYQTGEVARIGASWQGGLPRRQELEDWHADKLAQLDGVARFVSGIENTHQPLYLSEKLFDAFACGARPLYWAEASHRVWDMDLPAGAWINLAGQTPGQAAAAMDAAPWDAEFYASYAQAQRGLAALWSDTAILEAERQRLGRAIGSVLARLAAG